LIEPGAETVTVRLPQRYPCRGRDRYRHFLRFETHTRVIATHSTKLRTAAPADFDPTDPTDPKRPPIPTGYQHGPATATARLPMR
jgi:hypothetical protein